MGFNLLSSEQVHALSVEGLGLDPSLIDLTSSEAMACLARRAASLVCPVPQNKLIQTITSSLIGLIDESNSVRSRVNNALENLTSCGDLLEKKKVVEDIEEDETLIYVAPPAFVKANDHVILLIGIFPDDILPLPDEILSCLEYSNHIRRIATCSNNQSFVDQLLDLGLIELSYSWWTKEPSYHSPSELLSKVDELLEFAPRSMNVENLELIDSSNSHENYRARWTVPNKQTGRYVARREQRWGANIWCYVDINNGIPGRLVDFPLKHSGWRGCDDAWHLQAAIDFLQGNPQYFEIGEVRKGKKIIDFFSPLPCWARRRWDSIGDLVEGRRSLFSYSFDAAIIKYEINFIREKLWLIERST